MRKNKIKGKYFFKKNKKKACQKPDLPKKDKLQTKKNYLDKELTFTFKQHQINASNKMK